MQARYDLSLRIKSKKCTFFFVCLLAGIFVIKLGEKKLFTFQLTFTNIRIGEQMENFDEGLDRVIRNFNMKNRTETSHFVVLSSDPNLDYLIALPITVMSWKRLGLGSVVILIGDRSDFMSDAKMRLIYLMLTKLKANIYFIKSDRIPSYTLAQVSRIFAAGLPNLPGNANSIFVTADADLWSIHLQRHIPFNLTGIYVSDVKSFGTQRWPGTDSSEAHPHYPLHTIAMPVKLWREIMDLSPNWLSHGDRLADRLLDEFGAKLMTADEGIGSRVWYTDQVLISSNIYYWTRKSKGNAALLNGFAGPIYRLDRAVWHSYNFSLIDISAWSDIHFIRPLFENWHKVRPVMEKLFDDWAMAVCDRYYLVLVNGFMMEKRNYIASSSFNRIIFIALVTVVLYSIAMILASKQQRQQAKIFCFVITSSPVHYRIPALVATWLPKCDRYEMHTNSPLKPYPHVVLHNYSRIDETWLKLRLSLDYLYANEMDYDWFLRSCDDNFVIMENLREFLRDKNPNDAHYFGKILPYDASAGTGFNSGSAFVLSRGAIKRLIEKQFLQSPSQCPPLQTSEDDVQIAKCLANIGIYTEKTTDNWGKERFHSTHFNEIYNVKRTEASFSPTAISFHRLSANEMFFVNYLLYDLKIN